MRFETVSSEIVYRGRAFNIRRDQVRLPNDHLTQLDVVAHSGAVTILPLDELGQIWFVRQYRHAIGQFLLELPAGTLEPGEAPAVCARRELREEIGMAAGKMEQLGEFYLAPGYSTEHMHVYLATELVPDPLPGDHDEFLTVERLSVRQVLAMLQSGQIQDAKSLAIFALAPHILAGG